MLLLKFDLAIGLDALHEPPREDLKSPLETKADLQSFLSRSISGKNGAGSMWEASRGRMGRNLFGWDVPVSQLEGAARQALDRVSFENLLFRGGVHVAAPAAGIEG
jgi:hypothetical protein